MSKLLDKRLVILLLATLLLAGGLLTAGMNQAGADEPAITTHTAVAQQPTSTVQSVILPSSTPTDLPPTGTPTRTATPPGRVQVVANTEGTNVRSGPDINNDRIGQIQPGTTYYVIGKRFQWYQIEYPDVASRVGWVHESVVTVIGDPALIVDLDPALLPTADLTEAAEQETQIAATQTPGGFITLTAQANFTPQGFLTAEPTETIPGDRPPRDPNAPAPPTFTFPPLITATSAINTQPLRGTETAETGEFESILPSSGFAPIVPILGLTALGLMGLTISLLRR
jgi:hypothetical protein